MSGKSLAARLRGALFVICHLIILALLFGTGVGYANAASLSSTATTIAHNGSFTLTTDAPEGPVYSNAHGSLSFDQMQIQRSTNNSTWSTLATDNSAITLQQSGLAAGTYYYRARESGPSCSVSGGCNTEARFSSTVTVTVQAPPPPGTPASMSISGREQTHIDTNGSYTISWGTASNNPTRYELERSVNNGSYSIIYSGTHSSFAQSNMAEGEYRYRVRAFNGSYGSYQTLDAFEVLRVPEIMQGLFADLPDYSQQGITCHDGHCSPPLTYYAEAGDISLNWPAANGTVAHYHLEEKTGNGSFATLANVNGLTHTVAKGDGQYFYQVSACNAAGCGAASITVEIQIAPIQADVSTLTVPATASATYVISVPTPPEGWSASLEEQIGEGIWTAVAFEAAPNAIHYTVNDLTKLHNRYRYQYVHNSVFNNPPPVYPPGFNPSTAYSTINTTQHIPGQPGPMNWAGEVMSTLDSQYEITGDFNVTWGGDAHNVPIAHYELQAETNGSWGAVQTLSASALQQAVNLDNGAYRYKVRACNSNDCGPWQTSHEVHVLKTPSAPSELSYVAASLSNHQNLDTNGLFKIIWPTGTGVIDSYELQQQFNNTAWTAISLPTPLTQHHIVQTQTNGDYRYRVRSCNSASCSDWVNTVETVTMQYTELTIENSSIQLLPQADTVAITDGSAAVSHEGVAQYSLPISLPPALNDLAPALSLNYSSTNGDGYMGIGWSVSSLSSIHRCTPTLATEGHAQVKYGHMPFSQQERLCLDGEKLINTALGSQTHHDAAYWASGARYQTEVNNFADIQSHGVQDNGPDHFIVRTADGRLLTYGSRSDSQVQAAGNSNGPVKRWLLDTVEDRYGNRYTIHYHEAANEGSNVVPETIYYAPDTAVQFHYTTRNQPLSGWEQGAAYINDRLLARITTHIHVPAGAAANSGQIVSEYLLHYQTGSDTDAQRLSQVQHCGFDADGVQRVCAEPLVFGWQDNMALGFPDAYNSNAANCYDGKEHVADFNNDGYEDLFLNVMISPQWFMYKGLPQSQAIPWSGTIPENFTLLKDVSSQYAAGGSGANANGSYITPMRLGNRYGLLAVHDDGLMSEGMNVTLYLHDNIAAMFDDANAEYSTQTIASNIGLAHGTPVVLGDFNNDLYDDLFINHSADEPYQLLMSNVTGNGDVSWQAVSLPANAYNMGDTKPEYNLADYNNDGLLDFYIRGQVENLPYQSLSELLGTGVSPYTDMSGTDLTDVLTQINGPGQGPFREIHTNMGNGLFYDAVDDALATILPRGDGGDVKDFRVFTWGAFGEGRRGTQTIFSSQQRYYNYNGSNVDLNLDGLPDYVVRMDQEWVIYINTGKQDANPSNPAYIKYHTGINTGSYENQLAFPMDYDRDGRPDVIAQHPAGTEANPRWQVLLTRFSLNNGEAEPYFEVMDVDPFAADPEMQQEIFNYTFNNTTTTQTYLQSDVNPVPIFKDRNQDGLTDIMYCDQTGNGKAVLYSRPGQPDLLNRITNGLGKVTTFRYDLLTDHTVPGASQPVYLNTAEALASATLAAADDNIDHHTLRHAHGRYVVSQSQSSNGQGGMHSRYYYYRAAKTHLGGRGFLGFAQHIVEDSASQTETSTWYHQQYPLLGHKVQTRSRALDGNLVSISDSRYQTSQSTAGVYTVQPLQDTVRRYNLTGSNANNPLSASKTDYGFDANGCLSLQSTTEGDSITLASGLIQNPQRTTVVDNTDIHTDTTAWLRCFVAASTTTVHADNTQQQIHSTAVQYPGTLDPQSTANFVGSAMQLNTSYVYNAQGIITRTTVTGNDIDGGSLAARSEQLNNFQRNMYPRTLTNALGHSRQVEYDLRFGVVRQSTDPNGQQTLSTYDEFGRLLTETDVTTGTVSYFRRYWCHDYILDCPANAVSAEVVEVANPALPNTLGAPRTASYYDQLGRVVREETLNLNVFSTKVDTEYNNEGRIHRVSEPFTDNPQYWTVYSHYDALNRPGLVEPAAGGRIVNEYGIDYSGIGRHQHRRILTVADFNASGDNITERSTIYNSLGQVVQVTDPDNTPVTYSYNVQGNLKTTTVNHNTDTTITLTYNIAGLRDSIDDPDAGHIRFEYDALGQLRRQTWAPDTPQAKSQTLNYDLLGRQLSRVDVDQNNNSHTQQWHYDNRWLGALDRREGNGLSEERYFYPAGHQNAGQLSHIETTLDDANTRRFDYAYDAYGRPHTETTPGQLTIERSYHAAGFHCGTTDISDPANPQVIWLIGNENDSRGNIVDQLYGNGIQTRHVYDPQRGHLIGIRSGQVGNQIDTTGTFAATAQSLHYTYDSLGNLTQRRSQREDVNGTPLEWLSENFRYDNLNRLTNTDLYHDASLTRQESYSYDALGNLISKSDIGNLAYTQSNGAGVHAVTQANGQSYHYDTYGNMIQRGSDTVDYDVFNKPTRIGNHHFTYGPDRARYKQVGPTGTTYYIGNYEEVITQSGTEQRTTIDGFYLHTRQVSSGTVTTTYLHQDHLGSNEAMTDSSGDYIQRMRFNAWGERQQADGLIGDPTAGNPLHFPTTRGYTGHEMLDGLSLVHMNGRVYDPILGRFMTADILVQAPYNTQSYNRYSYVLNNPLSRIDPSGYKSQKKTDGDEPEVRETTVEIDGEKHTLTGVGDGETKAGDKVQLFTTKDADGNTKTFIIGGDGSSKVTSVTEGSLVSHVIASGSEDFAKFASDVAGKKFSLNRKMQFEVLDKKRPVANTIVTDGKGGVKVQISKWVTRKNTSKVVIDGMRVHEEKHLSDFYLFVEDLSFLEGARSGFPVAPKLFSDKRFFELRGTDEEINFLRGQLPNIRRPKTIREVKDRINQLEGYRRQFE